MPRGQTMDDANFFKWLFGVFIALWLFVTKWTHARVNAAHARIDEDRRDNGKRFSRIDNNLGHCRQEIDKELNEHMTEYQIKDFVDRSIKPLENKVDAIHVDLKTLIARGK